MPSETRPTGTLTGTDPVATGKADLTRELEAGLDALQTRTGPQTSRTRRVLAALWPPAACR